MKAPTPTRSRTLNNNWLIVARVPGVTFALAALLLPTAAAAGLAPFAATESTTTDLPAFVDRTPIATTSTGDSTPSQPPAAKIETPAATPDTAAPTLTTGQRLTPEQVEWFRAYAEEQRAQGLLRGNAVYTSW